MFKHPSVYILADKKDGTLRIGVTASLAKEMGEYQDKFADQPGRNEKPSRLVWYELHECMASAMEQQQMLKEWNRETILKLIEERNPLWDDLDDGIDEPD